MTSLKRPSIKKVPELSRRKRNVKEQKAVVHM
jgi:hypothetical protein